MISTSQLSPMPGFALIKLNKKYESGLSTDREKYAMNSNGTVLCVSLSPDVMQNVPSNQDAYSLYESMVGKMAYFTPFEDGDIIKLDGEEYVFVPVKQIRGVKN